VSMTIHVFRIALCFIRCFFLSAFLISLTVETTLAGSATWNLNPVDSIWTNANNWTPSTIPEGPDDVATFNSSNVTSIDGHLVDALSGIVFDHQASAYSITIGRIVSYPESTEIGGVGITNNSGILQQFTVLAGTGEGSRGCLHFINSATAGTLSQYTVNGSDNPDFYGGEIQFFDTASAGSGRFMTARQPNGDRGFIGFSDASTAGNATFINYGAISFYGGTAANGTFINKGGAGIGDYGGYISFGNTASAGNGTFFIEGAVAGASPSSIQFSAFCSAANATLIAKAGEGGGGLIKFGPQSPTGDRARVKLIDNGTLDVSQIDVATTIGSLEGHGLVFLGAKKLEIGRNDLDTTFSGVIQDGGIGGGNGGSLRKVGQGMLKLFGPNTYTGGTSIRRGTVVINNSSGSGTGSGPVQLDEGTLAGGGVIAGDVVVGRGGGMGAFLSPGEVNETPAVFTLLNALTFNRDGSYRCGLNSDIGSSDEVFVHGVTINSGARFLVSDVGNSLLTPGLVLTVINNTGPTSIAGTFANLPDGSTFSVKNNTYQASYEGGDGNDLTLTVVP